MKSFCCRLVFWISLFLLRQSVVLAMEINAPERMLPGRSLRPEVPLSQGMIGAFTQGGRYYWSIPDSLLQRDLLLVCRIEQAAAGNRSRNDGYAGDQVNTALFRLEKKNDRQLYLRKISLTERADSANVIFPAYQKSNLQSIVMVFNIKEYDATKGTSLIDVTDWLQSDTDLLYFSASSKGALRLGGQQKDKSEILGVRSCEGNVEIRVQKTYALQGGWGTATYVLHTSLLLLPSKPMLSRIKDDRVGYFTSDDQDFDANPYALQRTRVIHRWRLEPAEQDRERYFRGEPVEPVRPIVFYIAPTVPRQWVKYMIQGVNDWQQAFEKAGFKKAIYAREAPLLEEDSAWCPEDSRYSVIDYKASGIANAFGKYVVDPRSGEIIQSRIHFHHSLLQQLESWYFVQCAVADPAARHLPLEEEQMGRLVRMIIAHEVGHAIGLSHNFSGTATFSVEQLRNADFLQKNSHTTSIMDYTRLNYVVQPEDHIAAELLLPRVGVYDEWAVEWGYRLYPGIMQARQETALLEAKVAEKNSDPRFRFGREDSPADPRYQAEDLSSNSIEANQLGVANLQQVMKHLKEWTAGVDGNRQMAQMYQEVFNQYRCYLGHALKWIGGVYEESGDRQSGAPLRSPVEKERQEEAFHFLARNFLSAPPEWLFSPEVLDCMPERQDISMEVLCNQVFDGLLNKSTLNRLLSYGENAGRYNACELLADLDRVLWKERSETETVVTYRRLMEKTYVTTLCRLYRERDLKSNGDLNALLLGQLKHLQKITGKRQNTRDMLLLAHRAYIQEMITKTLSNK